MIQEEFQYNRQNNLYRFFGKLHFTPAIIKLKKAAQMEYKVILEKAKELGLKFYLNYTRILKRHIIWLYNLDRFSSKRSLRLLRLSLKPLRTITRLF